MKDPYRQRKAWSLGNVIIPLLALLLLAPALARTADLSPDRLIRPLQFIAYSPGQDKNLAETHKFIAQQIEKLGFQIDFKPMLRQGILQNMWFSRNYDLGTLGLTGRPTRVDPQLILTKLYHSQHDVIGGYNWAGYHNPEYDRVIEEASKAMDPEERKKWIWKAQEIATHDVPILTIVHQSMVDAYNNKKWNGFVNMRGNGLKNVWTWTQVEPLTADKVLVVGAGGDAPVLNPLTAHEVNMMVCRAVYDSLVKVGPDGHPQPWLAESWRYLSPTEIELSLRKGHKFHDGKPLTARDVQFTIDYILSKKIAFHYDAVEPIKEAKVLDDHTIRLLLHYPYAPLLGYTLEQMYILPEHIWKDVPEKTSVDNPIMWSPATEGKLIGSGFLKFGHWRKKDEIKLEANKEHFYAPKYEARIFKFIPSPEAMLGRFQNGEIDVIITFSGDPNALKRVTDANPNLTFHIEPSVGWFEIAFNLRQPPLNDLVVRQAISAVIPRDVIAKNIWKGFAIPAYSPIHPMLEPWYNPNVIRWEEQGLDGAREMLKQAGYEWDSQGKIYYPEGKTN